MSQGIPLALQEPVGASPTEVWPRLRGARTGASGAVPKGRSGRQAPWGQGLSGIGFRYAPPLRRRLDRLAHPLRPGGGAGGRILVADLHAPALRPGQLLVHPLQLSARPSRARVQGPVQLHLGQLRRMRPGPGDRGRRWPGWCSAPTSAAGACGPGSCGRCCSCPPI